MEGYPEQWKPLKRKYGARKLHTLSSIKGHCRTAKHCKSLSKTPLQRGINKNARCSRRFKSIPIEEQVFKKLRNERKLLQKWTTELGEAKHEYPDADIADESSSVVSKRSEIDKRHHILLPTIKMVMDAMEQAAVKKSSLNRSAAIKSDFSIMEFIGQAGRKNTRSKSTCRNAKAKVADEYKDPCPLLARRRAVIREKNHLSPKFRKVEQNVLCTRPDFRSSASNPSLRSEPTNELESPWSRSSLKTPPLELQKCKCKDSRDRKPCICRCTCEEEDDIYESKVQQVVSNAPSPRSELIFKESMQVQTSFPSSIAPCNLNTCPRIRKKKFFPSRTAEVQTEDAGMEWKYEPPLATPPKGMSISALKVPLKRTKEMDDRLMRRIMYFDCRKTSVANKNVQFSTYHVKKMDFPKNQPKNLACSDCPGSRKCNLVLSQHPFHLTCNEIVVVVNSLELNQEGLDSLKKVCSFLYIDYVFLGHVGNETNLAPVSSNVLFDSRKSFSLSLRFNKKERSILREQVNPTGLLVKDTIMFLVVTQAAPEFCVHKNRDFGFGYLSMKQIGQQMGSDDKMCATVEMQRTSEMNNKIGRLKVCVEGLKAIRDIKNERLSCAEPKVDAMMKKLQLNTKELIAAEDQTTCNRRTSEKPE